MIEAVKSKVIELLANEKTMHDWEHTFRVYTNVVSMGKEENADETVVALAALLHDCDDYKIFGQDAAEKLINTRRILKECNVSENIQKEVIEIIQNLGYSKYLSREQHLNKNGRIVFDADLLDSMGAIGAVRAIVFNALSGSGKSFDKNIFPRENLNKEVYQNKIRKEETAVNHMFEKMLKLKPLMYTKSGKKEAERRHQFMVYFLDEFFREQNLQDWSAYLDRHK